MRHTRAMLAVVHLSAPCARAFGRSSRQNSVLRLQGISDLATPVTGATMALEGNRS